MVANLINTKAILQHIGFSAHATIQSTFRLIPLTLTHTLYKLAFLRVLAGSQAITRLQPTCTGWTGCNSCVFITRYDID